MISLAIYTRVPIGMEASLTFKGLNPLVAQAQSNYRPYSILDMRCKVIKIFAVPLILAKELNGSCSVGVGGVYELYIPSNPYPGPGKRYSWLQIYNLVTVLCISWADNSATRAMSTHILQRPNELTSRRRA
jgi:hypothetical protein